MGRFETKICIRVEIENGQNFLKGQVHGIKDQVQIDHFFLICLAYKLCTIGWIDTKMDTRFNKHGF